MKIPCLVTKVSLRRRRRRRRTYGTIRLSRCAAGKKEGGFSILSAVCTDAKDVFQARLDLRQDLFPQKSANLWLWLLYTTAQVLPPSEMLLEFYGKSFSPAKKIGNILFPDDVTTEDVVLNMPLLSSTTLRPVMDAKLSQKCGFDPTMRMGLSRRFQQHPSVSFKLTSP